MKKIILIICLSCLSLIAQNLNVTVSILPQKYFVEKIAQDKVTVNVMVKPGFSPHNYEPKTSQMKNIASSKIYFAMGVSFEKVWLNRFKSANKNIKIVDISKNIKKLPMINHEHHSDENNQHNTTHDDVSLDPHVWLDPILVKIQAQNILETLVQVDIKNKDFYEKNYHLFINELDMLDNQLKKILAVSRDKSFMVFHPSWGYFAARYDLEQIPVEVEGKQPKISEIIKLVKEANEHNIRIIFVSPQFSQKSAEVISSNINGTIFIIDPLSYDYKNNLINTAHAIYNSYK